MHIDFNMILDPSSLYLFSHILFSLWLSWKTIHQKSWTLFLPPAIQKIYIVFHSLFILCLSLSNIDSLFLKCLLLYIPWILACFTPNIFYFYWKERFLSQFEFFINSLIARIKTGAGFRSSFKMAVLCLSQSGFQNHFMEILESITFSKPFRPEFEFQPLKQILLELRQADRSNRFLDHLENLRHQISIRSQLRKKMKSVLFQFRIQSFILFILYICLFVFVLYRHGLQYPKLLIISLCLFITGLIFLLKCGKKIRWTI